MWWSSTVVSSSRRLISARHRDRVEGLVATATAAGAKVRTGGRRPPGRDRGWFVEPTVFNDVQPTMTITKEEIFGPVVSFITYKDVDDAIDKANSTIYGLHGAVYTQNAERGYDIARRVRSGSVTVNGLIVDPTMPFGGFKQSGTGREGGIEGLDPYFELKTVYFA